MWFLLSLLVASKKQNALINVSPNLITRSTPSSFRHFPSSTQKVLTVLRGMRVVRGSREVKKRHSEYFTKMQYIKEVHARTARDSADGNVQVQHNNHTSHGSECRDTFVTLTMRLGHDLVADDVEHRAGGEAHRIGKERLCRLDSPGPEDGERDLDEPGPHPHQARIEVGSQAKVECGHRNGKSFWNILDADGQHQLRCVPEITRAEAHSDGKALWNIVERNGYDEKPDGLEARIVPAFRPHNRVQMGQQVIGEIEDECSRGDADEHRPDPAVLNPWQDKAGEARCEHDPGGEAQRRIEKPFRGPAPHKHEERADRVHQGDHHATDQPLPDRILPSQRHDGRFDPARPHSSRFLRQFHLQQRQIVLFPFAIEDIPPE